jgi:hypothetical protein
LCIVGTAPRCRLRVVSTPDNQLTAAGFSPAARRPIPVWGKVLLGCAAVAALLGVAAGVLVLAGVWWVFNPGTQIATDRVVTPDAVAVVRFSGEHDLDALSELATLFFAETSEQQRRADPGRLPEPLRWLERMARAQDARAGQGLGIWLPREVTAAVVPDGATRRRVVMAANLRGFIRPIRWFLLHANSRPGRIETRFGTEVVHLRDDAALAFAGGTLLWTDQAALLDGVLREAKASGPARRPAFLPGAEYDGWTHGWDLALVADGRDGRVLARIAGALGGRAAPEDGPSVEEESLPSLGWAAAGARFATADRLEARVTLAGADAASAQRWRALLDSFLAAQEKAATAHGLTLAGSSRLAPGGVTADVRLDGVKEFVRRLAARRVRRLPPGPPGAVPGDDGEAPASTTASLR